MSEKRQQAIEVNARFSIQPGKVDEFREAVSRCVERVRANEPGALRYDWFVDGEHLEAVAMDAYTGPAALQEHLANVGQQFREILKFATASMSFLGDPGAEVLEMTRPLGIKCYPFFGGLADESAAGNFTAAAAETGGGHIEIVSDFAVLPGKWERFCALSRQHIDVVRRRDTGTLRYDWFMDEASQDCITLDTYSDAEGMFSHMRNCHDIHGEYRDLSKLETRFLGALPKEAAAAVASYEPRVLPFFMGLKAYSGGGFQ